MVCKTRSVHLPPSLLAPSVVTRRFLDFNLTLHTHIERHTRGSGSTGFTRFAAGSISDSQEYPKGATAHGERRTRLSSSRRGSVAYRGEVDGVGVGRRRGAGRAGSGGGGSMAGGERERGRAWAVRGARRSGEGEKGGFVALAMGFSFPLLSSGLCAPPRCSIAVH